MNFSNISRNGAARHWHGIEKARREPSGSETTTVAAINVRVKHTSDETLIGHDHGINHRDHAVGLEDIRDGHEYSATRFILQHDALAFILQHDALAILQ